VVTVLAYLYLRGVFRRAGLGRWSIPAAVACVVVLAVVEGVGRAMGMWLL
jgi:hypothetical protein